MHFFMGFSTKCVKKNEKKENPIMYMFKYDLHFFYNMNASFFMMMFVLTVMKVYV